MFGFDRSKAASTLADVLSGIQGGRPGYTGEAFRQAVLEECGWVGAGSGPRQDGPLLEIVRTRVEVRLRSWYTLPPFPPLFPPGRSFMFVVVGPCFLLFVLSRLMARPFERRSRCMCGSESCPANAGLPRITTIKINAELTKNEHAAASSLVYPFSAWPYEEKKPFRPPIPQRLHPNGNENRTKRRTCGGMRCPPWRLCSSSPRPSGWRRPPGAGGRSARSTRKTSCSCRSGATTFRCPRARRVGLSLGVELFLSPDLVIFPQVIFPQVDLVVFPQVDLGKHREPSTVRIARMA